MDRHSAAKRQDSLVQRAYRDWISKRQDALEEELDVVVDAMEDADKIFEKNKALLDIGAKNQKG